MISSVLSLPARAMRATRQLCLSANLSAANDTGEWLADTYPNISLILNESEKLIYSLVQRLRVTKKSDAVQLVDELQAAYAAYVKYRDEHAGLEHRFLSSMSSSDSVVDLLSNKSSRLSGYQFYELKNSLQIAKAARNDSHKDLLQIYNSIPNILSKIRQNAYAGGEQRKLPESLSHMTIPSLAANPTDMYRLESTGASYLLGQTALSHLQLTYFTAEYMEAFDFEPISSPSFLRNLVLEQTGLSADLAADLYTLQTRQEQHSEASNSHSEIHKSRKAKGDDDHIYHVHGLSELTFMAYCLRHDFSVALPLKYCSVGDQYRMPYSGKPVQSKVGIFVTLSATSKQANKEYMHAVRIIDTFWKMLKVPVEKRAVEPHLLLQHEAGAVEFVCSSNNNERLKSPIVLSKASINYDYISRRIMAYSKTEPKPSEFCHFVTGHLVDINLLLDVIGRLSL